MYLKRLTIVAVITLAVSCAAGWAFDSLYRKRWHTLFFDKTDELLKTDHRYDIIFLGNSRVHFGINPYYTDSVTGLRSYNFGTGGADAEDIMLTATLYLQKHQAPELAVISLDMGALTENETLATRFHYLYYLQNDTMSSYMCKAGFLTGLIRVFPFTRYSFFDEYNRTSLFITGKPLPVFGHNIYKGFLNIHEQMNSQAADLYNSKTITDSLWPPAISYFKRTIDMLQKKGTAVIFVWPPERISSGGRKLAFRKTADSVFINIAEQCHIKQLHLEHDMKYTDSYFVDDIHLNEPGTRLYSIQLADSIKTILVK